MGIRLCSSPRLFDGQRGATKTKKAPTTCWCSARNELEGVNVPYKPSILWFIPNSHSLPIAAPKKAEPYYPQQQPHWCLLAICATATRPLEINWEVVIHLVVLARSPQ